MKTHLQILATTAMAVLLAAGAASAYDYGWDPAKAPLGGNNSMYMELAQDPTLIMSGPFAGKYEYFFDLYNVDTTFYFLHLTGLDNSKIANQQQLRPTGADTVRTQRWGDPDGWYDAWPTPTGRIFDLWSKDVNASSGSVTAFDKWRSSYADGAGGWTDSGLAITEPSTGNPHSYNEYVEHSGWGTDVWKAELTGAPPQPLHWYNTQFGIVPTQDTIYVPGGTGWSTPWFGGLIWTLRVVYDEPIDPLTIGWGGGPDMAHTILGDFTVPVPPEPPLGSFDGDMDVDEFDIDLLGDAIRTSSIDFALFDISADGVTEGTDGAIDILDLDYLVRFLVDTTMGVGTGSEYGDFNLDGLVDTTDLTRLATYFGPGTTWAEGNANRNIDLLIDTTDLTILGTYFGFDASADAIPEPMTLFVMGFGAIGLLRKRRS